MVGYRAEKKGGRGPIEEIPAVIQVWADNDQTSVVAEEKQTSAVSHEQDLVTDWLSAPTRALNSCV